MSSIHVLRPLVTAQALALTTARQVRTMRRSARAEDGLTTLEIVIWALGLFLAATAAIGVITAAINSRVSGIS